MVAFSDTVTLVSGTAQFRIKEDFSDVAPTYFFYGQSEVEEDLVGANTQTRNQKQVRTFDSVCATTAGDVVFSLISGKATIVQAGHSGYLLTQNYCKLVPSSAVDAKYLVYMLNENKEIRHQLQSGQQGSTTLKYTIKQLSALVFPFLPSTDKQKNIGELYFNQLRVEALKKRVSTLETALVLEKIKGANKL